MNDSTMMYEPLLISSILQQSVAIYSDKKIISRAVEGGLVEHSYREVYERSTSLAKALLDLGVELGEPVATLAWNTHRHVEAYYAISGIGAVVHTVNPRLFDDQIVYIINHAQDRVLLVDLSFVPLLARIMDRFEHVQQVIVLTDEAHMPEGVDYLCYEALLAGVDSEIFRWPSFDEQSAACLCYTSGTTGNPKGVMYSHRSTVLHALASCAPNALNLSEDTIVMPVVPMYHVSAWGIPYSGILSGSTLVLPGDGMDGASLYEIIDHSQADLLLGVPTVWLTLLAYLREQDCSIPSVKTVAVGGAAAPRALVEELWKEHGVYLMPLWGMTETSPLASFGSRNNNLESLDESARFDYQCSAGRRIWGIECALFDDEGQPVANDGEQSGNLAVKGHWVTGSYYRSDSNDSFYQGWFDTGDVATLDEHGVMKIVDRKKDVIKSGGEWISSIELENAALSHPDVREACVVGVPHPKWDERPLLFVCLNEGAVLDTDAIMALLTEKVAKWWLPDAIIQKDSLPHTATGKLLKHPLRDEYRDYLSA